MSIYDAKINTLEGEPADLSEYKGKALLVVNVASKCGLTPQYKGLEELHEKYADRGFEVLGFPCNQFMGQEPGSAEEIREFCDTNYSVQFPLFEKIDVNGANRHPLYEELTAEGRRRGRGRRREVELREVPGRPPARSWPASAPRSPPRTRPWSRRSRRNSPVAERVPWAGGRPRPGRRADSSH